MSKTTYRQTDSNVLSDIADYVRVLVGETLAVTTSTRGEVRVKGCRAKIICVVTEDHDSGRSRDGFYVVPVGVHEFGAVHGHHWELPDAVAAVLVHREHGKARKGSDAVIAHWRQVADALAGRKMGLTA